MAMPQPSLSLMPQLVTLLPRRQEGLSGGRDGSPRQGSARLLRLPSCPPGVSTLILPSHLLFDVVNPGPSLRNAVFPCGCLTRKGETLLFEHVTVTCRGFVECIWGIHPGG